MSEKLTVTYLHEGAEVTKEVGLIFADYTFYDILRSRSAAVGNPLPKQEEAQMLFMGASVYKALVRIGAISINTDALTFIENIVSLDVAEDEEEPSKS